MGLKLTSAFALSALVSLVTVVGCAAPVEQEEEFGETEDNLLAGRVVSPSEVAGHLRAVGFAENMIGKMVCTAKWESTFYARAKNGSHYGLYQISKLHFGEAGCPSNAEALYDPRTNIECAYSVYRRQGIGAWVAYKAHKKECDAYRAPASADGPAAPANDDDPTDADDNKDTTPTEPGAKEPGADACWSPSIGATVEEDGCVQSKSSGVWFQCQNTKWYRGGDASSGPYGACTSSHPR